MLDQLDRPVLAPGAQPPCRARQAFPQAVDPGPLEQQHLTARSLDRDPRRDHAAVIDDDELVGLELLRQLGKATVPDLPTRPLVDEEPRVVAALERPLRDQLRRERVIER